MTLTGSKFKEGTTRYITQGRYWSPDQMRSMQNLTVHNYHSWPGVPQITTYFTKPDGYNFASKEFRLDCH
jgi:hypothetical protein